MRAPGRDPWAQLARWTPARIALGRTGASLPTREVLAFALAHARARDAVHLQFDPAAMAHGLARLGLDSIEVSSDATDRAVYLRRPDFGRRLSPVSREALRGRGADVDLALVVGDGLSSTAIHRHAAPLIAAFQPLARRHDLSLAPVVLARGARVALGDEIGELLQARVVAVLIGERPGLSAPDSLGVYLTFGPRPGRNDAERNCISNIRSEGLSYEVAAFKLAWLAREALRRSLTGVDLKDASDLALPDEGSARPARITPARDRGRR
jgi:ethanolamine ammonia-lyase small subunit